MLTSIKTEDLIEDVTLQYSCKLSLNEILTIKSKFLNYSGRVVKFNNVLNIYYITEEETDNTLYGFEFSSKLSVIGIPLEITSTNLKLVNVSIYNCTDLKHMCLSLLKTIYLEYDSHLMTKHSVKVIQTLLKEHT
jgi:hypothetical protein